MAAPTEKLVRASVLRKYLILFVHDHVEFQIPVSKNVLMSMLFFKYCDLPIYLI